LERPGTEGPEPLRQLLPPENFGRSHELAREEGALVECLQPEVVPGSRDPHELPEQVNHGQIPRLVCPPDELGRFPHRERRGEVVPLLHQASRAPEAPTSHRDPGPEERTGQTTRQAARVRLEPEGGRHPCLDLQRAVRALRRIDAEEVSRQRDDAARDPRKVEVSLEEARLELLLQVPQSLLRDAPEERTPEEDLEHDQPEGVEVRALARGIAAQDLGGEVTEGRARAGRSGRLKDASNQHQAPTRRHPEAPGLEVAVDQSPGMQRGDRPRDLQQEPLGRPRSQRRRSHQVADPHARDPGTGGVREDLPLPEGMESRDEPSGESP
jgi:hypothetical protein